MRTHTWALTISAAVLGAGLAAAGQDQRQMPTTAPPARAVIGVRTVATVKQVMRFMVIPASDALFKVAGEPPSNDAGWAAVELQALAVAEGGNLLMIGNRPMDRAEWMRLSRAMVEAASEAATAAGKKDAAALSTAGDKVYETCEACHAKYMKKGK
jgi:hypothetical protein